MFFRGEIREAEAGVCLDDTNSGKKGEVKTFSNGLGADQDVEIAIFNLVVEEIERFGLFIIGVKTGDASTREEFFELGFEELGAKTFMDDVRAFTFEAV